MVPDMQHCTADSGVRGGVQGGGTRVSGIGTRSGTGHGYPGMVLVHPGYSALDPVPGPLSGPLHGGGS